MHISRRTYTSAALFATAIAVYGSLVPLRFTPIELAEAIERFRAAPYLSISPASRADWVSNILLFVPLGYLWLGALTLDVRRWTLVGAAALLVSGLLATLSLALEFAQLWFPPRTVSQNDIIAEAIGGFAGAALWMATGQATAEWLRGLAHSRQPHDRVTRALEIYFVAFAIYAILPLDLTLSAGELWDKLRNGRIVLRPFSDLSRDWVGLYGLARDIVVFLPVGMLAAVWQPPAGARVRSIWMTTIISAAIAGSVELAQVFILSRYASTTDVAVETMAGAAGGWFMTWLYVGRYGSHVVAGVAPAARRALWWVAGAGACLVVMIVLFLAPFEVGGTAEQWRARYHGIWAPPFARLYYNTEFNAVSDVARKVLLWGVFGACLARAGHAARLPRTVDWLARAAAILGAATLSFAIELAQVMMPARVPDITDVLLAALGAALGVWAALAISRR